MWIRVEGIRTKVRPGKVEFSGLASGVKRNEMSSLNDVRRCEECVGGCMCADPLQQVNIARCLTKSLFIDILVDSVQEV